MAAEGSPNTVSKLAAGTRYSSLDTSTRPTEMHQSWAPNPYNPRMPAHPESAARQPPPPQAAHPHHPGPDSYPPTAAPQLYSARAPPHPSSFTSLSPSTTSHGQPALHPPPPPQGSSGTGSLPSDSPWFPQNLQQSSSLPDGEQLVHLPSPYIPGQPSNGPPGPDPLHPAGQAVAPSHTLPSPQIASKVGPTRGSRKKDRLRDDPQTLDELRDPLPGSKPDYPYPVLIKCAILSHTKRSPTLSEIYEMIHGRFDFFKMDDASWKNSVRHYLSISPSFEKLPRPITEPGKGNYWTYNPNPTEKTRRKSSRSKAKAKAEEEALLHNPDMGTPHTNGSRPAPPPALHTPSSGGDSSSVRDRGIASRQRSPAHQWLEARDPLNSSFGAGTRQRENVPIPREQLPSADTLFHKDSHVSRAPGSAVGPPSGSYPAGGNEFNPAVPQSPYAAGGSPGRPGGSAPPLGGHGQNGNTPDYMYAREQPYSRPSSAYGSQQSLPPLGESFLPRGAALPPPRHGDDRTRHGMHTNGSFAASTYSHGTRSPYDTKREPDGPTGHLPQQPYRTTQDIATYQQPSNW